MMQGCIDRAFLHLDERHREFIENVNKDGSSLRAYPDVVADPRHGEWYGYCDRQGKVTNSLKGGAYKGCFHVPRALFFSVQRIEASSAAL